MHQTVTLVRDSNQARGLAQYAIDFLKHGAPSQAVATLTKRFFVDATLCAASALAQRTNAPQVLRRHALNYRLQGDPPQPGGSWATVFGSLALVPAHLAVRANCAAVREWDANGTNFGYRPELGHTAGEFGHNDFYHAAIAGAEVSGRSGAEALLAMILLDEIRGRLAEVFSLKDCKVDHVLHGGIATAAAYGALRGAMAEQIESAIGMVVSHHIPFRAIRAGKALSDSKGASAAITASAAVEAVDQSMLGFEGPRDIFRNPEAIFRLFAGPGQTFQRVGTTTANIAPANASPFDLVLSMAGDDFAIGSMHFKFGLYEHQSAGAIEALHRLIAKYPELVDGTNPNMIRKLTVSAYKIALGIIGDPSKRNPQNRQTADHSMVYIVARVLKRALYVRQGGWIPTMLGPEDYSNEALQCPITRELMEKIEFRHGGEEYDRRYPMGIPTSIMIETNTGDRLESGLVMYPGGHARNASEEYPVNLDTVLDAKFAMLGAMAYDDWQGAVAELNAIDSMSTSELRAAVAMPIRHVKGYFA